VAALQFELPKTTYEQAMENARTLVNAGAERGAKIICFPEHWLLEYQEHGQLAIEQLCALATETKSFLVTGANYTPNVLPTSPELRVRSLVISPDGKRIGLQDKVHLSRTEKTLATPGNQYSTVQTPLGKLGVLIGNDAMFPEAARTLALKGTDLLCAPSKIGQASLDQWLLYLKTRALENRVPIIAPNIFRPPGFVGGSVIIDLTQDGGTGVVAPRIVASAGAGEKVLVGDVSVDRARSLRRDHFLNRRPTAYFGH